MHDYYDLGPGGRRGAEPFGALGGDVLPRCTAVTMALASTNAAIRQIIKEQPRRCGLVVSNGTDGTLLIALDRIVAPDRFTLYVPPGGTESVDFPYDGKIAYLWANEPTQGRACLTELVRAA